MSKSRSPEDIINELSEDSPIYGLFDDEEDELNSLLHSALPPSEDNESE